MHIPTHLPQQAGHCSGYSSSTRANGAGGATQTVPDTATEPAEAANVGGRRLGGRPDRCGDKDDRHDHGRHNGWRRRDEAWAAKYERFMARREHAIERVEQRGADKLNNVIDRRVGDLLNRDDLTDEQRTAIAIAGAAFDAALADGSVKPADAAHTLLEALAAALTPAPAPVDAEPPAVDPPAPAVDAQAITDDTETTETADASTAEETATDPATTTETTTPTPAADPQSPVEADVTDEPSLADLLGSLREAIERVLSRTETKVAALSTPKFCGCAFSKFHDAYLRLRGDEPVEPTAPAEPPTDPAEPVTTATVDLAA